MQDMPRLREVALLPLMKGWAEKNPESLTAYCLEQGGKDNLPDDVSRFCTYPLAGLSPEKSVAWMNTLPPEEALKKLDIFDEKTQNDILGQKTYSLCFESPKKAIDGLTANVPADGSAQIIDNRALFRVEQTYTHEFTGFLDKMSSGSVKDSLLAKVVSQRLFNTTSNNFRNNKMENSLELASGIVNEEKKSQVIDAAMRDWILHQNEEADARRWLNQSFLPAEQKETYLRWCDSQQDRKEK